MKNLCLYLILSLLVISCDNKIPEEGHFHAVKSSFTEQISVPGSIRAVNTTYIKSPRMFLSTIIWVEEDGALVEKGDTVCLFEHPDVTLNYENIQEQIESLEAELEKLEADHQVQLALLNAEIENNDIQLAINSLDSIQKRFAPPIQQRLISLQQQKAKIQEERLNKKFEAQKTIGETEIRGLQSRIRQMENRLDRANIDLQQLTITAPISGLLLREELPRIQFMTGDGFGSLGGKIQEGSTTWSNMNILQIPDLKEMEVLTELSESDYKKVEEGQKVFITVDARNGLETTGTIKTKLLSGNQRNRNSEIKTYEAVVKVDSLHEFLTPGLNARCDIVLKELTDTLLVPAIAVFEKKDKKYVYVLEGRKYREKEVETGSTSSTYTIINSGLEAGEYLSLNKPAAGKIIRALEKEPSAEGPELDSLALDSVDKDSLQNNTHSEIK